MDAIGQTIMFYLQKPTSVLSHKCLALVLYSVIPRLDRGIQLFQRLLDCPVPPKGRRASKPDNDKQFLTQDTSVVRHK